jgi:hypothetical protein
MGKKAPRLTIPPCSVEGATWIPLTKDHWTLVDNEDYATLASWSWYFNNGYAVRDVRINGVRKSLKMHRVLVAAPDNLEVDHISGDKLDNRRSNLRIVDHAQNMRNVRRHVDNRSGVKGVRWHTKTGMWQARIMVSGKTHYLGYFASVEEAGYAYDAAARELHGTYARTNP